RLDHLLFKENQRLLGATTKTRGFRIESPEGVSHATFSVFNDIPSNLSPLFVAGFFVSGRSYDLFSYSH
ncbi:hypothetical protein, partial [Leptospira kirschneri]|uniref:hypothetical protein n=2 Tax=Leptospira kirschneri TaxID=29507 RepID=UPI001E5EDFCB